MHDKKANESVDLRHSLQTVGILMNLMKMATNNGNNVSDGVYSIVKMTSPTSLILLGWILKVLIIQRSNNHCMIIAWYELVPQELYHTHYHDPFSGMLQKYALLKMNLLCMTI
jgi:predicted permease